MKDSLIVKSNQLIEARYDLSLNEQKIVLYAASKLDRGLDEFDSIEFDIKEFTELLDTKGKRYDEIRDIIAGLRRKDIIIDTDEQEYIAGWIAGATFYKNTGKVELEFSKKLVPYLLQLKNKFTRYQLKNILYLKGKYSIRFYELLKQYEKIRSRQFELEELKQMLFIESQYDRIYDLKRFVLEPSVEEINEHTDINISYTDITKGRKVIGFTFKVEPKKSEQEIYIKYLNQNYNIKEIQLKMGLAKENFNTTQIMNIYELAVKKLVECESKDIFEYVRLNYLYMIEKGAARNKYSYLMDSLENDYANVSIQLRFIE